MIHYLITKTENHSIGLDINAFNIQRGRDWGLDGYIRYFDLCRNHTKESTWSDLKVHLSKEVSINFHNSSMCSIKFSVFFPQSVLPMLAYMTAEKKTWKFFPVSLKYNPKH